ncbi:Photosynthetic reaction center cytochrome C subunit [Cnuella takakiae]|uniref:Photosynthetic reaction center cytochrome c subunit n=1 Tax=Cnuella takakiae TaxID=1302690 RepID=A0A1M5DV68_9BACT|nr:c-type cytochrome [Cnuella takakiae]OLY93855.1 hypothetical protein BUE76_19710 [Cnuella takakiae]SHF70835.1 Photosynthetic reaction center cytochrome C subunit [Cnuella takakiae]
MKQTTTILLLLLVVVASSFALNDETPRYKNLKVMPKNTTKQQMDSVMKHFTSSMGVKCNFCHVFNQEQKSMDFASDANEHKGIARSMMNMTAKLNKKFFDVKNSKDLTAKLEVTCYTCHNGKAHPAKSAAPAVTAQAK